MLTKESKMRVIENFYGIDYTLFGKPVAKINNCCPIIKEEYVQVKGALLSVFIEMLKLAEHTPKVINKSIDSKILKESAIKNAKIARLASRKIVTTEKARYDIKTDIKKQLLENKDVNVTELTEKMIREKAYRLAVDNLLVTRSIQECKKIDALNEWTGKIIEDAYKILRDNLCETATMILDDE